MTSLKRFSPTPCFPSHLPKVSRSDRVSEGPCSPGARTTILSSMVSIQGPESRHCGPRLTGVVESKGVSPTARISTSGGSAFGALWTVLISRVGFKPPATISQEQPTARYDGSAGVLEAKGRHDPCVVPRAIPIVETMSALVLMECVDLCIVGDTTDDSMLMQQSARKSLASLLPPLTHLPPTMVLPGKKTVEKVLNGDLDGQIQNNKTGDE